MTPHAAQSLNPWPGSTRGPSAHGHRSVGIHAFEHPKPRRGYAGQARARGFGAVRLAWLCARHYRLALQTRQLPHSTVFLERHRLFYLFYQVEIRYRQLPQRKRSHNRRRKMHESIVLLWQRYGVHALNRGGKGSSLKMMARPVEQVERGSLMLEAHHRRGDRYSQQ
jgi:hypothetical protein